MIKLKDIPVNILNDLKIRSLNTKVLLKRHPELEKILVSLEQDYNFNLDDLKKSVQYNIELTSHKCKTCGKTTHFNKQTKNFSTYCCMSCMSKDPDIKAKSRKTNLKKYGVETPLADSTWMQQALKKKHGVKNTISIKGVKEKIKATCLEKYGVAHAMKNETVKAKLIKTNQIKYGGNAPICSAKVKQKIRNTVFKVYGVANPMHNPGVKAKCYERIKEAYKNNPELRKKRSYSSSFHNPLVKQKARQTMLERYGEENFTSTKHYKDLMHQRSFNYVLDKVAKGTIEPCFNASEYQGPGYDKYYQWKCKECGNSFLGYYANATLPVCRNCHPYSKSKVQEDVEDYIQSIYEDEICFCDKKTIKPYELDILIPKINIAIEVNGDFWHSILKKPDAEYHLTKTKLCEEKGIHLIHIFENAWNNKPEKYKRLLYNIIKSNIPSYPKEIVFDRTLFNKVYIENIGYKVIKEIAPSLISIRDNRLSYYDCGKLVAIKDAKN